MKKIISIMLAAAMLISVSGCGKKQKEQQTDSSAVATNVTVKEAQVGNISNTVTYTGEIKAADTVAVSPKVGGKIISVNVEEGQYVNAGDVLFKIDDTDLKLQYQQSQASYNSARVSYDNMKNSTTKQSAMQAKQAYENAQNAYDREKQLYENNSDVKVAETAYENAKQSYETAKMNYDNNLTAARNDLTNTQTSFENTKALFEAGGASQTEYDRAKTAYENSKANLISLESNQKLSLDGSVAAVQQAEENLKKIQINAGASLKTAELTLKNTKETYELTVNVTNKANTKTAEAGVVTAASALKLSENNLKNATVTAPISGYISSKKINAGEIAAAGMSAITIHNTNSADGEVHVTESVISLLALGTPAKINVKSADITDMTGTISQINQIKDTATGMYTVKVNIPNDNNVLKPGMFADVTLQTAIAENVIYIPSEAILQSGEERFVYVANGDTAEKRIIAEGVTDGENTEIISGISEGDSIVIKGKDYITEKNNQIKIVEE